VQLLEAASVVLSSGPRIFDTAGVLRIPTLTKSSTVGFVGENELIPSDHDTTFDEVVLMPTDRKSIKVIERYSRELARQAIIGIDATLTNRLVKVVSDKLDDVLVGKGQATNEVQTITIAAGGNPFTLGFRGAVTSSIANAAAAAIVQTAIQGLATVGSGNATVAGSAGGPYTVMFAAALANSSRPAHRCRRDREDDHRRRIRQRHHRSHQPGRRPDRRPGRHQRRQPPRRDRPGVGRRSHPPNRWFVNGTDFIALRKLK